MTLVTVTFRVVRSLHLGEGRKKRLSSLPSPVVLLANNKGPTDGGLPARLGNKMVSDETLGGQSRLLKDGCLAFVHDWIALTAETALSRRMGR
jgi:hypothetical protein